MISERDFYWLAGILEGEGSFYIIKDGKPYGRYKYSGITMNSIDKETIERVHKLVGGKYYYHEYTMANQQPSWLWRLRGIQARLLMLKLRPLMSPRRQGQINEVLAHAK
jgi:hypothetical protein